MKYSYSFLALILCSICAIGQFNPLFAPNTYQNSDNPYYWKNRSNLVANGYWQQDVHYSIDAQIDEETDIITAHQNLVYTNNSPYDLEVVYFHLYQNAFQPGSYMDELQKANHVPVKYGKYESQKLGTTVDTIRVNGIACKVELDNTILKVYLPQVLKSHSSITFEMNFKTYFDFGGTTRRRMKEYISGGFKHYNGVHWYPRICVFDKKFGWTTDQHLGKEFYGDFGTYDVSLQFNSTFILEATGNLINENEVLPDSLKKKLDISNFSRKPYNSKPSIMIPYVKGETKTWKYHAENVHDFAFTADPSYRRKEVSIQVGGIFPHEVKVIALAQEQHAALWQNAAEYTAKIIETYNHDIGVYAYNKMVVADAADGMEYPMITLDEDYEPIYRGLFAHEVGHNWFFGMVGNNETYRACLDEGFTQFLTAWCMKKLDGNYIVNYPSKKKYLRKHANPMPVMLARVYNQYLNMALRNGETTLNTHSDNFNGALGHDGGYRQVYYKTATMLYNLQYVLGDSLFIKAMQNYFDEWKIAHPYIEDFRNSIINYTHVDLNWFFDQWIETNKTIDYGIKKVRKHNGNYEITFKRYGRMQMPLDFTVEYKNDSVENYHIPNDWFVKKTTAKVLPKWFGWDNLNETYKAVIPADASIKQITIDTTQRLADVNRIDNIWKKKSKWSYDYLLNQPNDWQHIVNYIRPDIWFNQVDGIKLGFNINGSYVETIHKYSFSAWYNTIGFAKQDISYSYSSQTLSKRKWLDATKKHFSYNFSYQSPLKLITGKTDWYFKSCYLDGLESYKLGLQTTLPNGRTTVDIFQKTLRRTNYSMPYLLPTAIDEYNWNSYLGIVLQHKYSYAKGTGNLKASMRTSSIGSFYNYAAITLESVHKTMLGKFDINTRMIAQYGSGKLPAQSALYVAGANTEELYDNKYVRSNMFFRENRGYSDVTGHFQFGGGLNLRGYNGYKLPQTDAKGNQNFITYGNSGAAINAEIGFERFIKWKIKKLSWLKASPYLFADAGLLAFNNKVNEFSAVRIDAGIGSAFTIKKWWVFDKTKPLTVRIDLPLFLNTPPFAEGKYVKLRWLIGIERAF